MGIWQGDKYEYSPTEIGKIATRYKVLRRSVGSIGGRNWMDAIERLVDYERACKILGSHPSPYDSKEVFTVKCQRIADYLNGVSK